MSSFWDDEDGNFWESPRAVGDDRQRGRCTGTPDCCINYFIAGGLPEGLGWEYVPCPECVRIGNHITPRSCIELKNACTCGTWANRRPLELEAAEQGDYVETTDADGNLIIFRRGAVAYMDGI